MAAAPRAVGRHTGVRVAAALCLALAVAGCGGGSGGSSGTGSTPENATPPGGSAAPEAPKGGSPLMRQIYRQFPRPKPDPRVKGSAEAIKKGEQSCEGKTPLEVREEFQDETHLQPEQEKMVAKLPDYEGRQDPDFAAGQLAALVYEGTIADQVLAAYGSQGCIYSLARRLQQELAAG